MGWFLNRAAFTQRGAVKNADLFEREVEKHLSARWSLPGPGYMAKSWALVCLQIRPNALPMAIKRRSAWKLTGDSGRWVLTLSLFAETAVKRSDCLKNSDRRSSRSRGNKNALQLASCAGLKRSTIVQTVLRNRFPFLAFACCSNIYRGHWVTWRRWKTIRGEKFSHLSPLVTRTQH